jgi:hypothetical protein
LQVELLCLYDADAGAPDATGQTAAQLARRHGHTELADRLVQLEHECTDRLSLFLCSRRADHQTQHFLIPQMATSTNMDATQIMLAKRAMQVGQLLACNCLTFS